MLDQPDIQKAARFALDNIVIFGPAAFSILASGFLAGRYVLDKEISILKAQRDLVQLQLTKAQADLDVKTKALLSTDDPLDKARIRERKQDSDRTAAFRFVVTMGVLFAALLSGGCLYWLNGVATSQKGNYEEEQRNREELHEEIQKIADILKQTGSSANTKGNAKLPKLGSKPVTTTKPAVKPQAPSDN